MELTGTEALLRRSILGRLSAVVLLSVSAAACTSMIQPRAPAIVSPVLTSADARDTATGARREIARVTHVDLDLALDFAAQAVGGTATPNVLPLRAPRH